MNKTGIEYLTHSWNPIAMRCSPVSEGCENCWHLRMCKQQAANHTLSAERRVAAGGGPFVLLDGELNAPLRLRKPAVIGLQFMGDLFHPFVAWDWQIAILRVIFKTPQHRYILLTKRPLVMAEFLDGMPDCPLPNLYLGVSVENQKRADERIPKLLETPAAVRIISAEPLLGPIELAHAASDWWESAFQPWWLIIGPETGLRRRPSKLEWTESLIDQADGASIPSFVKAVEINGKVTSDPADWPQWARRREFPKES